MDLVSYKSLFQVAHMFKGCPGPAGYIVLPNCIWTQYFVTPQLGSLLAAILLILITVSSQAKALKSPQKFCNFSVDSAYYNVLFPSPSPFPSRSPSSFASPSSSHSLHLSFSSSSSCSSSPPPTLYSNSSSFLTVSEHPLLLPSIPLVPALFIIGDSTVDCGNNNFVGTFARADRLPYGRDFDTHQPTGGFCNGRIPVDYFALLLGLPLIPSYLSQSGSVNDMIRGVNYASAGAGIIFTSGSELGQRISFTQQIQQFSDTLQLFILSMGEEAAADLISKSVFYISIGINDYIHYYLRNVSNVQSVYTSWDFNHFLASTVRQEIKVTLSNLSLFLSFCHVFKESSANVISCLWLGCEKKRVGNNPLLTDYSSSYN
ncbi:GDSL esterase/lipase At3g53100-like [Tripterygium wilfordii]|uniref:GDSL esterase/lipase At3g53100-like n=1 Tax=Tripterygium wilfordii TaxID=458696 RepID=UPI0018F7EA8F|nr:GDSL esterase/lipase At3g53100-like [Tripterygium wilfordii]